METKNRLRQEDYLGGKKWWIDITDLMMDIFGDIVERVEISNFYDYTEDEAIQAVETVISSCQEMIKNRSKIDISGNEMRITFINGKKIEISNSEWCDIRGI